MSRHNFAEMIIFHFLKLWRLVEKPEMLMEAL